MHKTIETLEDKMLQHGKEKRDILMGDRRLKEYKHERKISNKYLDAVKLCYSIKFLEEE